jgi:hypothetical protein
MRRAGAPHYEWDGTIHAGIGCMTVVTTGPAVGFKASHGGAFGGESGHTSILPQHTARQEYQERLWLFDQFRVVLQYF